jgi:hypothetical protein
MHCDMTVTGVEQHTNPDYLFTLEGPVYSSPEEEKRNGGVRLKNIIKITQWGGAGPEFRLGDAVRVKLERTKKEYY